jgi:hypothetical protein
VSSFGVGCTYNTARGAYTVTSTLADRVSFIFEDAFGQKAPGSVSAAVFASMVFLETAPQHHDRRSTRLPRKSILCDALIGVCVISGIALLLRWRGFDFWWYWPIHFAWKYWQDF